jgi:hypothetical protein
VWKAAQVNPDLHLHDLRHTGATLAGQQASLKELMARIGHSSTRAAMIYQHTTRERDHAIAVALDLMIQEARGEPAACSGTQLARQPSERGQNETGRPG